MPASQLLDLRDLSLLPPTFGYVAAALFGAVIGSFLNVVIHRVPLGKSIVFPNSRCPSCGHLIAFYDNVPVLSYVALGGKCRGCKKHISIRYPIVEALTALLFFLVALQVGFSIRVPFDLLFSAALLTLVFINAEHLLLPNTITYPGLVFAIVARFVIPYIAGAPVFDDVPSLMHGTLATVPVPVVSLIGALLGALVGGGSLWLIGWLVEKLRGVEVMGLGNVKLMFMVGAYFGWRLTLVTMVIAFILGTLAWLVLTVRKTSPSKLPSGVFLGLGALTTMVLAQPISSFLSSWS
jgi:leader peptidase (prepilin peptidase)/N-methyltransferase